MSQIDDFLGHSGIPSVPLVGGDVISDVEVPLDSDQSEDILGSSRESEFIGRILSILNRVINVHDRNDIINPEQILSGFWDVFDDTVENRALYEQYLNALRNYQSQQESFYQEWYNSTSQQALRDQQAGLNPDILGISGLSNASQADVGSGAPMQGLPTSEELNVQKEQLRLSRFQSVMTAISSICSIPSSFAGAFGSVAQGLGAIESSKLSKLQATEQFEKLAGSEIASRLSDSISASLGAGQSLDLASWFADENNFSGILDAYGGADYANSFANVRKRMQRSLGSAYADGKVTAENQGSFSSLLADPRYSSDQLVQIAHLKPYMSAKVELERLNTAYQSKVAELKTKYAEGMSVDSAIDAANSKFKYDGAYYESLDGAKIALQEWYVKECDGIVAQMKSAIEHNLLDMYNQNPNNERGFAAAYLSGSRSMDWYEYLIAQEIMFGLERTVRPSAPSSSLNGVEVPSTNPPSFMGASPSPSPIRSFIPPGSVGF